METMTYTTQNIWTAWIAVYLFFGGMGAALIALSTMTDMYWQKHKGLAAWGTLSGFAMLGAGTAMLFIHLLDHLAVVHLLNPMAVVNNPSSWIAWGTQFIIFTQVTAVLYALPIMVETPTLANIPVLGRLLRMDLVKALAKAAEAKKSLIGWIAVLSGAATAVYTGLLLQSFPAVALWHNPAVPILFTVSAFSTALAFQMLVMNFVIKDPATDGLFHHYERSDAILIGLELLLIFSLFNFTLSGSESGYRSAELLWGSAGWVIGFVGFGLIVPLLLEITGLVKGWASRTPIMAASIMVLGGGYLLRHYFMAAGVYAFPW